MGFANPVGAPVCTGIVVSVNAGRGVPVPREVSAPGATAIDKRPLDGRVPVGPLGLTGDEQCDKPDHGGEDQAVYAYAREDYASWEAELGRVLPPGLYGENLTTRGLDLTGAVIGERWAVGSALLEVSCPRIPCRTFAWRMGEAQWVKRFTEAGLPGAYLRVLSPGDIASGDDVTVLSRPAHGVTILDAFRCLTGDRTLVGRVAGADELGAKHLARVRGWADVAGLVPRQGGEHSPVR